MLAIEGETWMIVDGIASKLAPTGGHIPACVTTRALLRLHWVPGGNFRLVTALPAATQG